MSENTVTSLTLKNGEVLQSITSKDIRKVLCMAEDEKDIFSLTDVILGVSKSRETEDLFWIQSEKNLLNAIMLYLWKQRPCEEWNYSAVVKLNNMAIDDCDGEKSPLDFIFEDLETKEPEALSLHFYKIYKAATSPSVSKSIVSSIAFCLANLAEDN